MNPTHLVAAMRPRQWTKNLVVFAALIFSLELFNTEMLLRAVAAFAIFCVLSGVVYLMNDLKDRELDRAHPLKKTRPIASGALRARHAVIAIFVLGTLALACAWLLGISFFGVSLGYLALNIAYSFALRNLVLLDVIAISTGFVLRAIAGARVLTDSGQMIEISAWLLMCTFFLSLFLALGKRRHELRHLGPGSRASLAHYSVELVDRLTAIALAVTVICYSLYTLWPRTVEHFGTEHLIFTIPVVFYGLSRYLYLVLQEDKGADPSEMLLTDRSILATIFVWIATVAWILYSTR